MKALLKDTDARGSPPDVRGTTDIVRAAIVCETFAAMVKLVELIGERIAFAKDRYTHATDGGWSDVLLLIRYGDATAEVQIIHKRMCCRAARLCSRRVRSAKSLHTERAVQRARGVRRARGVQLRARRRRADGVWGAVVAGAGVGTAVAGDGRGVV